MMTDCEAAKREPKLGLKCSARVSRGRVAEGVRRGFREPGEAIEKPQTIIAVT